MAETETGILFRGGERAGARYVSGRCVFDECLADGRLVSRYWNPNGQVWPEMHYPRQLGGPSISRPTRSTLA